MDRTPLRDLVTPRDEWITNHDHLPVMLVGGVLPRTGTAFIVGRPKSGKSWLAFDLAISVENGVPFLNLLPVDLDGREHGRVLYLSYEGSEEGARVRFRSLLQARGISAEHGMRHIDVVWRRAPFLTDGSLLADLAALDPPWDVIVVDTLSKAWEGEENSNSEASALMRSVERVAARGSLVVFLHHTPKSAEGAGTIRGAGAFHGATDATIRVSRRASHARLSFELRDAAPGPDVTFTIDAGETGEAVALSASVLDSGERIDDVDRETRIPASITAFLTEKAGTTRDAVTKGVNFRNADVGRVLTSMVDDGSVVTNGRLLYVAFASDDDGRSHVPTPTGGERGTLPGDDAGGGTMTFLTCHQLASLLHRSPRTVQRWARERRIPHVKLGRATLFTEGQVNEIVEAYTRAPVEHVAEHFVTNPSYRAPGPSSCRCVGIATHRLPRLPIGSHA